MDNCNSIVFDQFETLTFDYNELMIAITSTKSIQVLEMLGKHLIKIKKTFSLVNLEFAVELYQEKLNELNS